MSAVAAEPRVSVRRLHWRPVAARDGSAGELRDVLFDDQSWLVRYLVIDTIGAMPRRDVLVRPAQVEAAAPLKLRLTRDELKQRPDLDEDRPVYLQYDMAGLPRPADPHLRSGEIDTGVWLPGRRRAIVPREVRAIDWIARTIDLG